MTTSLTDYRAVWNKKAVLRLIYDDLFERIAGEVVDGLTIELGGGVGNLKDKIPSLISSDIQFAPWLDLVVDAQNLPFSDGSVANIVMLGAVAALAGVISYESLKKSVLASIPSGTEDLNISAFDTGFEYGRGLLKEEGSGPIER